MDEFYKKRPQVNFREASYDFQYGFTRNRISDVTFILTEKQGNRHRVFDFDLRKISMKEFEKYLAAIKEWHRTGELNIGPYQGVPNYSHWYRFWLTGSDCCQKGIRK